MALNSPKTFTLEIENIVKDKNLTHMEAVLWYCQNEGIEPDTVGSLIWKGLKQNLEANARELNFLPKQAQLPIWLNYGTRRRISNVLCYEGTF